MQGKYDKSAYENISREFMRLLSYSDDVIEEKISKKEPESPYLLIGDEFWIYSTYPIVYADVERNR